MHDEETMKNKERKSEIVEGKSVNILVTIAVAIQKL